MEDWHIEALSFLLGVRVPGDAITNVWMDTCYEGEDGGDEGVKWNNAILAVFTRRTNKPCAVLVTNFSEKGRTEEEPFYGFVVR